MLTNNGEAFTFQNIEEANSSNRIPLNVARNQRIRNSIQLRSPENQQNSNSTASNPQQTPTPAVETPTPRVISRFNLQNFPTENQAFDNDPDIIKIKKRAIYLIE